MWETKSVQITVRLPHDIAEQAERVQKTDPEFLSRVVFYGLTRRSIYRHIRELAAGDAKGDAGDDIGPIPEEAQRGILEENGAELPGGGRDAST